MIPSYFSHTLHTYLSVSASVTKRVYILSIFGHLQQVLIAQKHKKLTKVDIQFSQVLNTPPKNCQSGEMSPHLVTLVSVHLCSVPILNLPPLN